MGNSNCTTFFRWKVCLLRLLRVSCTKFVGDVVSWSDVCRHKRKRDDSKNDKQNKKSNNR